MGPPAEMEVDEVEEVWKIRMYRQGVLGQAETTSKSKLPQRHRGTE
jgi:hypothetical protein